MANLVLPLPAELRVEIYKSLVPTSNIRRTLEQEYDLPTSFRNSQTLRLSAPLEPPQIPPAHELIRGLNRLSKKEIEREILKDVAQYLASREAKVNAIRRTVRIAKPQEYFESRSIHLQLVIALRPHLQVLEMHVVGPSDLGNPRSVANLERTLNGLLEILSLSLWLLDGTSAEMSRFQFIVTWPCTPVLTAALSHLHEAHLFKDYCVKFRFQLTRDRSKHRLILEKNVPEWRKQRLRHQMSLLLTWTTLIFSVVIIIWRLYECHTKKKLLFELDPRVEFIVRNPRNLKEYEQDQAVLVRDMDQAP
ncbi:hypothetical protein EJ04DRAFT_567892 [Polyplosphaeria fusca]|uniref:Uncharacterized protein n=1 Tax=Polyplosphaeria fusca TaxID=682080 RepID=A0A9P4UZH8_9PLEO|nr:hypothetical protein EJ04DRAFT_567892 [Polyplosphaeria fusca]